MSEAHPSETGRDPKFEMLEKKSTEMLDFIPRIKVIFSNFSHEYQVLPIEVKVISLYTCTCRLLFSHFEYYLSVKKTGRYKQCRLIQFAQTLGIIELFDLKCSSGNMKFTF